MNSERPKTVARGAAGPEASGGSAGLATGELVAGKYRIEQLLGEGGMGSVFAAVHVHTGRQIALKWMLPELAATPGMRERFQREARAAGRIDHPNVVGVLDVGEHEESLFLVMPLLRGISLRQAMDDARLDDATLLGVLVQAMRGVAAAHEQGVIHRDLKPDNIFLSEGPDGSMREPKVLDFGISKVSVRDESFNRVATRTGTVMGTPHYMSLEQISGDKNVDGRADVYAMGVIAYEALTGSLPFDRDNFAQLVFAIGRAQPAPPHTLRADLPEALSDVLLRAIARAPADRFEDIRSFAAALEPWSGGIRFEVPRSDWSGRHVAQQPTRTLGRLDIPAGAPVDSESPTLCRQDEGASLERETSPATAGDETNGADGDEHRPTLPTTPAIRVAAALAAMLALASVAYAAFTSRADEGVLDTAAQSEPARSASESPATDPAPILVADPTVTASAAEDSGPPDTPLATDEPATDEPATDEPATDEPATDEPASRRSRRAARSPVQRETLPRAPEPAPPIGRTGTGMLSAEEF